MRQYLLLILSVAVCGVGGALALSLKRDGGFQYEQEWVSALLQIGLIGVLGLVTSIVLERFKDALQQRRDSSKLRFDVLKELSRAYMDAKLVRRKIQADKVFTATESDRLNEIQVVVELHKNDSIGLFRQRSELEGHLKTMERYLNKVANEAGSSQRTGFDSKGFDEFSDTYHKARNVIWGEISGDLPARQGG